MDGNLAKYLMFRGWFDDRRNDRLRNLYQDVKEKSERRQARTTRVCRFAGRNQRKVPQ